MNFNPVCISSENYNQAEGREGWREGRGKSRRKGGREEYITIVKRTQVTLFDYYLQPGAGWMC